MAKALVWSFLAIVWGTTWMAISIGLRDLPPITFAGFRFLLGGVMLWGVLAVRGVRLPRQRKEWWLVARTGLLIFVINYSLQFWGMQYVSSGMTSVMFATVPLFTLLIAHYTLHTERLTVGKLAGVLLGVVGVAVIFSEQIIVDNRMTLVGCLAFLVAASLMARAQVDLKANGGGLEPTTVLGIQMPLGGLALLALGGATEGNPLAIQWTSSAAAALLYLALVGSAVGFLAFYWLLKRIPVAAASSMMLVHPVVALTLGGLILGEPLTWQLAAGAAAIIAGLSLVLRPAGRPVPVFERSAVTGGVPAVAVTCSE